MQAPKITAKHAGSKLQHPLHGNFVLIQVLLWAKNKNISVDAAAASSEGKFRHF